MQRWQDELGKHPVNTTVKQLIDVVEQDIALNDPIFEIEKARFAKIIYWLRDTISSLDPDFAPIDVLNQIHNHLQNNGIIQAANSLISSQDGSVFRDLNTRIEPILSYISQIQGAGRHLPHQGGDLQAATIVLEQFLKSLHAKKQALEEKIDDLQVRGLNAAQKVADVSIEIERMGGEFQTEQSNWKTTVSERLLEQKSEFAQTQTENQASFSEMLSSFKSDGKEQFKKFFEQEHEAARAKQVELEAKLSEIISSAEDMHTEVRKLYSLVAHDAVTGGHKEIADREYKAARNWRWITVLTVGATVAWLLCSLFGVEPKFQSEREFWLHLGKSVSLTALMLSFGVYASKQSALHRVSERRARAFFLQVQAFDPFIANLEPADRQELKKALSARIFGPDDAQHDKALLDHGDFKSLDKLLGVMEGFRKLFGKA